MQSETDTGVSIERISLSQDADIITVTGISGEMLINAEGGDNYVNYQDLDPDFKLDLTDGVMSTGETYTSRLTDGESSLYFVNVADENIARREAPISAEQEQSAAPVEDSAAHRTNMRVATEQMQTDLNALNDIPPDGTMEDNLARELASTPMPLAVMNVLHHTGIESLKLDEEKVSTPQARIIETVRSGVEELDAAGVPKARLQTEYEAIEAARGLEAATYTCLLYTSPSPRDLSTSRMPSSA